jgi:hypothetical protein
MLLAFLTTGWLGREEKATLAQGNPTSVLGYTLSFRGIEKPTPTTRDAMVVDVSQAQSAGFELRPKLWVNPKSNQLVANPDIRSSLTHDLYVAPSSYEPPEEPVGGTVLALKKGEATPFRDWTLRFEGFQMAEHGAMAGAMAVGVAVEVSRPGAAPVKLVPKLVFDGSGQRQMVAVEIPGVPGASLRTTGMNADAGIAFVELLGVGGGIGRTAVLHRGERLAYRDLGITFAGFDLEGFDPEGGKIDFGVQFEVDRGGAKAAVVPRVTTGRDGGGVTPAEVPGSGGITLSLGRIDAEGGAVELQVLDPSVTPPAPAPAKLVLDVSTKPLIGLVWLGTILVVFGVCLAVANRARGTAVPVED